MPIVAGGAIGRTSCHVGGTSRTDAAACARRSDTVGVERRPQGRVVVGEQGDGEQPGVRRPGIADGERGDGNTGGHLDDRQQRVLALEVARRHGDAEHRNGRLRRQHAGKVGGPTGPGDDRPHPASRLPIRRRRTSRRASDGRSPPAPRGRPRNARGPRRPCASSASRSTSPSPRRRAVARRSASASTYRPGMC